MQQIDGVKIMHGRVVRVPEMSHFNVEVYCPETRILYEFFGCQFHGHTCQPFRDVITINGDTLAERYESAKSRFEHMTRAG